MTALRPRTGVFVGIALVACLIMIASIFAFALPLFSYDCGFLLHQKFPASDFYSYKVVVRTWQEVEGGASEDGVLPLEGESVSFPYDDDRLVVWNVVWNERNRFAGNFGFTILSFILSLFTILLTTIPCAGRSTLVFLNLFTVVGFLLSFFMFSASGMVAQSLTYDVDEGGSEICSEFAYGSVRHPRGAMAAQAVGGVLGLLMFITALSPRLWRWARIEESLKPMYRPSHFNMKAQ